MVTDVTLFSLVLRKHRAVRCQLKTYWSVRNLRLPIGSTAAVAPLQGPVSVNHESHHNDVMMSAMASQTTDVSIVCWTGADQRKHQQLRVTGPCAVTGEFPTQKASNAEKLSNWRRHHDFIVRSCKASDKWDSVLKCGHRLGIWQLPRHLWWRHQMETFSALLARCGGNSPVNSPHKGQWRGDLMFSLICT